MLDRFFKRWAADLTIFSVGDGGTVSLCENNGGAGFGLKPEAIPA